MNALNGCLLKLCFGVAVALSTSITVADTKLQWSHLPALPDEHGFGGPIAGVHNGALIVAGGANFPDGPPWSVDGRPPGMKVWHDRIFVLEPDSRCWINAGKLPRPLAYAPAVSTAEGIYILGGETHDATNHPTANIILLRWDAEGRRVSVADNALPPLPKPCHYHNAAAIGNVIHVVASHAKTKASQILDESSFWSLDLAKPDSQRQWKRREPWPGPAREKMSIAVQKPGLSKRNASRECLYMFSGSTWFKNADGSDDLTRFKFFTDAYRYDPSNDKWKRIADLPALRDTPTANVDESPRPAGAASAVASGGNEVLLFSGATGRSITADIAQRPLFPRDVLSYRTDTNQWTVAGQMPTGVVTTSAVRWNNRVIIPSGETQPGVRTNAVQALNLTEDKPQAMQNSTSGNTAARPNVLFIAVDDLRPALRCYGDETARTPNIDRLASRGTLFNRAYCQAAVCCPSRLSLLTGRRPDTIRVWDLKTHFRAAVPQAVTLPQHFKDHGYLTQSLGKIFHGSGKPAKDPPSWSVDPQFDVIRDVKVRYALPKNLNGEGLKRSAAEAADVPDNTYLDGIVCDAAVKTLSSLQKQKLPFFLAVGFRKPHLPFCAPQKYWDMYDRDKIPLPVSEQHPQDAPEWATRSWMELEGYSGIPKSGKLTPKQVRKLRHGYYACVSFIDAQVGRLLDELQRLKLADNTIVVLWGDHGFHLGEQGLWTKANNYELSTRAPLIFSVPGLTDGGAKTNALVEFVDVYPTLADICGLDAPDGVEGISLTPLLEEPDRIWKTAAFSQYPRDAKKNRHQGHGDIMGYAVRTDGHRYVEWREWQTQRVVARELYDQNHDPNETKNIAASSEKAPALQQLSKILADGWKSALPRERP